MKNEELLEIIAPCSLVCYTCAGYEQGIICESAKLLLKYLEGVREFYEKNYPDKIEKFCIFEEELKQFSSGRCTGCRNGEHHGCSIQGCFILACTKAHGVDLCGKCEEFPCNRTKEIFDEEVYLQWLEGNEEIKLGGIREYWKKSIENPHYKQYRKI